MHITLIGVPLPKIDQKPIENRSEIDPKTVPNRSQIGPKSVQNRSKIGFGTDLAANIDFGPFWNRFRTVLGPLLAASWRPLGGQVGVKLVQKSIFGGPGWRSKTNMMLDTFLNRFLVGFGAILGSKIDPKSVQNRSQERSWHKNTRPCFDPQKPMVFAYFWPSGGSKIDQKSIKFVS